MSEPAPVPATADGLATHISPTGDVATVASVPASSRRPRVIRRSAKFIVGCAIVGTFIAAGIIGPFFVHGQNDISDVGLVGPSGQHWLGTTNTGQDVFKQLVVGARGSMTIGVVAATLAVILSVLVGVIGGYLGGRADEVFSLLSNVVLVLPGLPLVIVITDFVANRGTLVIAAVIAFTSWAASARVLRAQTMSIRERDYVDAARASGEPAWRVIGFEVLPNLLPIIFSQFVFGMIAAILTEAGLAFLGLGNTDAASWGSMLYFAQNGQALALDAWWWFIPPGLCIALAGTGLSLINFSIDEVVNPRLRAVGRPAGGPRNAVRAVAERTAAEREHRETAGASHETAPRTARFRGGHE
jgi:peptide/nickel transport system permease protein